MRSIRAYGVARPDLVQEFLDHKAGIVENLRVRPEFWNLACAEQDVLRLDLMLGLAVSDTALAYATCDKPRWTKGLAHVSDKAARIRDIPGIDPSLRIAGMVSRMMLGHIASCSMTQAPQVMARHRTVGSSMFS